MKREEEFFLKVAVTYENGMIFQHFGHTEYFKIFDITDGKITNSEIVSTMGSGHGALAGFLKAQGVDTLICGGIGGGARMALEEAGIRLYGGAAGLADDAVNALISGNLSFNPEVRCSHHEHSGSGHSCGSHGCGSHSCH
ncbi:MAG: dinitrogenase iron-molybdenum cofactor biosynthesis protein [Ruminococcus sp.]|nr:dinitrogenase iron-molybdenum cofactor biosynthesis protein [Ruminococcus sp.]